jgi:beta-mannosidase
LPQENRLSDLYETPMSVLLPSPVWQLARLHAPHDVPAASAWIPATVPGAVQLDWGRARGLPDLNYGQNVATYDGLENDYWLYCTHVPDVPRQPHEKLFLAGAGLDYHAEVRVGGQLRLTTTGNATPFELDLSDARPGSTIEILIHPAPKRAGAPPSRTEADHSTKPAVSYGWDWHPRLITLGLSEDARFELRPQAHLRAVDFAYELAPDFSAAEITVTIETSIPVASTWQLRAPNGEVVLRSESPRATLRQPELWWTHDQGTPALYRLEVELASGDRLERKVGFRRARLVMAPDGWTHPAEFPKSRSHPPITFELNGRTIFAKGSNWVNPEIFHGTITAETYRPLLQIARDAHFNLLRCWGGAPVAKEPFFAQCDELGLLVWQEFPLACNLYPDRDDYLQRLDEESRAIIRRVRQHPSLALWCGGNELFNSWSRMTDQSLPLRLLNRNCYDLDRGTPFIATAPLDGMGHGDYRFIGDHGRDIFQIFQRSSNTAYTEFGCPGPSPVEYLKTFIPPAELWPPRPGTSWETHHGFGAWDIDATTWLCTNTLNALFGSSTSLEELVARGEWLQCEGLKSVFEEARRQSPHCAMALNWCYNEPWPTAANNSIVNWPAQPKPAYHAVRAACRPTLLSARIPHFQWQPGELFTAEIWLLHDAPAARLGGKVRAVLHLGDERHELARWDFPAGPANRNLAGPVVRFALPEQPVAQEIVLELVSATQPDWSSQYRLHLRPPATDANAGRLTPTLNA